MFHPEGEQKYIIINQTAAGETHSTTTQYLIYILYISHVDLLNTNIQTVSIPSDKQNDEHFYCK